MFSFKRTRNAHEAMEGAFKELQREGRVEAQFQNTFILGTRYDGVKEDICHLHYNGAIVSAQGFDMAIAYGRTNSTWRHLAGSDEALMFARIDWDRVAELFSREIKEPELKLPQGLPKRRAISKLNIQQLRIIFDNTLSRFNLINSWENELSIRNGIDRFEFKKIRIPEDLITETKDKKTTSAPYAGVRVLLRQPAHNGKMNGNGLVLMRSREVTYKKEVVGFLADYITQSLVPEEAIHRQQILLYRHG